MAKPIKFTPKKAANGNWLINIPAKYSESGKRERHFYPTRDKALKAAEKLKAAKEVFGTQATAVSPTLAEAAIAAQALLEPLGVSLLEAVRRFVELEKRNRQSVTVQEAITEFRKPRPKRKPWSDSQARAYRLRGEKLIECFGDRLISTIGGEELAEHLDDTTGGPGAYNQAVRLVRTIWRWCAEPPRKWCDSEAVAYLSTAETIAGQIGVLTHDQAKAVMTAAETYFPDAVPAFAIALFTGIRQAEIDRLTPEDITSEGITIHAEAAKTSRRRFLHMPEPLKAWLDAYPITDSVTPATEWRRKRIAVRRLAGFRVWSDLVPRLNLPPNAKDDYQATPPGDLPRWPANALRHTAATIQVQLGKPLEALIFEHGHTGGVEMLRRHYVGAMMKSEALKIWSIRPSKEAAGNRRRQA